MEIKHAVQALAALAQETRLAIFRLLVQSGPAGLAAGRLGAALAVPPATLSFHLKELANAGLVGSRQEGRFVFYSADFERMAALMGYLTENCCRGMPEACVSVMEAALGNCCAPPSPRKQRGAGAHRQISAGASKATSATRERLPSRMKPTAR